MMNKSDNNDAELPEFETAKVESSRIMFSAYELPQLLQSVMEWEREIAADVPELETPTGYFLKFNVNDNGGYMCSPVDSIVFANTGMDGIHFSLLTDFGSIRDLNEAPVICVSPMDFGNQVRIVAENIHDFFALCLLGHRDFLLNDFPTKEAYLQFLQRQQNQEHNEYLNITKWRQQQELVSELAIQRFQFQPIDDPFAYVSQLRAKRAAAHETMHSVHPWSEQEFTEDKLEELAAFAESAEKLALLAFIRDYQQQAFSDDRLTSRLHQRLEQLGFLREAQCLLHCMPSMQYSKQSSLNPTAITTHICYY